MANQDEDTDGDGVVDSLDLCPATIIGAQVDIDGCPPAILADMDRDGDVDLDDFGSFQSCLTGPGAGPVESACAPLDYDADDDIDQSDYGYFQRCLSGANTPAITYCDTPTFQDDGCPLEVDPPGLDVSGTFRYAGFIRGPGAGFLSGSITFDQVSDIVNVTQTTYDFTNNREVIGQAQLVGNRLDIQLEPISGGYTADVVFIFTPDGDEFCVEFHDTNGDFGDLGSFDGTRQ